MQRLEVSGAVRPLEESLGVKGLIIAQRDATQNSLFIILLFHCTCFGCQPHPSPGVHKTVTTASGTGHIFVQLPPSIVAMLVAAQYQRLQLQFCVLLMMGVVDTRKM